MSIPPKPKPKPGRIKVFRALYNYVAQQADELSFEEGDILYIQDDGDGEGWWRGTCKGKSGLIPSNYVSDNAESIDFPLHEASKRGNMEFLNQCLQNQVSVNSLDKSGSTPLYWAAHSGHVPVIEVLLSHKNINLDAQNKLGDSALHAGSWKGQTAAVSLLLEAGANAHLRNNEDKSASELAKNPETLALLQRTLQSQPSRVVADYCGSDSD